MALMGRMRLDVTLLRVRKLVAIFSRAEYRRAFLKFGVAASIEHDSILRALPFDLVVDVGANRGQFSLASLRWRAGARVIAFEPLQEPASKYRRLFSENPAVSLHEVALARERGEMTIHVSRRDDSSSLLPIADLQTENFPGTERISERVVPVGPLSDFVNAGDLDKSALLKVDVQGSELSVLRSAETLLSRFRWIYAECSFMPLYEGQALAPEIEAYLLAHNFRKVSVSNISRERKGRAPLQGDFLFENTAPRTG